MALKDIFLRFRKEIETTETYPDDQLKTHFYKGTFNQLFTSVEQIFRQDADCRISTVSKEHGEIAIEINKPIPCFLIVTIISEKPLETAVDFTISTERTVLLGTYPVLKHRIISFYERINKVHHLSRVGKKI
ncbi:MAG: hypothetical protein Q8934_12160 [Bacillota bacterium]|nr:hypothetical protein [Bacillota bacterium]